MFSVFVFLFFKLIKSIRVAVWAPNHPRHWDDASRSLDAGGGGVGAFCEQVRGGAFLFLPPHAISSFMLLLASDVSLPI